MWRKRICGLAVVVLLMLFSSCGKNEHLTTKEELQGIFNSVWNDFDNTYPYFVYKQIDWDSIYHAYYPEISENTTSEELFHLIGEMTLVLRDIHVSFSSSDRTYHYSKRANYPIFPPTFAINYLADGWLENAEVLYGNIKGSNYWYLRIKSFSGNEEKYNGALAAMDSLENKNGFVLDIRNNGGGNELIGRKFAGRLTESETLYKYVRIREGINWDELSDWYPSYLKPQNPVSFNRKIILLTNRGVYSSAELFVLMMKTIPHMTMVGDTTGGASANPKQVRLPNGWEYYVSTWQSASTDHQLLEDNGIAPDHYIQMTESSMNDGRDLILEKALELLATE